MGNRKSTLFTSKFDRLGYDKIFGKTVLLPTDEADLKIAQKNVVSEFCEELLLFDKVSLKADRINYALYFLIQEFGIDTIQEYLERGLIEILLWTPIIVTSTGMMKDDGTIDESAVLGKPPIVSGTLSDEDSDPDRNVDKVLRYFTNNSGQIKSFIKTARNSIILPNNALASQAVNLTVDAYKTGKLVSLGLQNQKSPENLDVQERGKLQELSHDILETSILAQYEYKSLNQYSYTEISSKAFESIGQALQIQEGNKAIFKIENVPDLKMLFFSNHLNKKDLKSLRYKSTSKAYRKWLSDVTANQNSEAISKEYINEITGRNNFWDKSTGKIVKNIAILGVGAALGVGIGGLGIASASIGAAVSKGTELGLGLFDSFYLDGLLKGKNPRMFIDDVEKAIAHNEAEIE